MNHYFDARDNSKPISPLPEALEDQVQRADVSTALCGTPDCLDNLKRDRFEMISAYLDGEGSSEERRQVECWLKNDATVQQLYSRLLRLREGIQTLPVPVSSTASIEQTIDQVFARLDAEQPKATVPFAQAELLSAYLDGEVTPAERQQVERWLANDPALQRVYAQMQQMHHAVQTLPMPEGEMTSADVMADRVFARVQRRRTKRVLVWGGAAAAAAIAGVATALFGGFNAPTPQLATNSTEQPTSEVAVSDDALMIALDRPIIEIPKVSPSQPPMTTPTPAQSIQ
ncbi:MAG: DUF4880 domain-containing protein [Synechococcales cyanobacterium T60_A2020_003]|nr:DUF4880 domain-containing protein [Synechococcales cyanobacterium T60_A2020_003]